jgi:preprotein translocase subunit SecG
MYTFLLVILIVDSLVLVAAVLMQAAKGGGLAATFGGVSTAADALLGTRQAGDFLSKLTWWSAGTFLFLGFMLQIMTTSSRTPRSILDQLPAAPVQAPTQAPPTAVPLTPPSADTGAPKKNP